jgi:hypothetical protein
MQHPTSRPRRVRRVIAISAAAVAVMIAPTACDYGGPAQMDMTGHSGHMDGMNMDEPTQEHQVVPVGNTRQTGTDSRRGDGRDRGDRQDRGGRGNTGGNNTGGNNTGGNNTGGNNTGGNNTGGIGGGNNGNNGGVGSVGVGGKDGKNNGLDVLGRDCTKSQLRPHDGFQDPATASCVSTQMGEVAAQDSLPSLLIVGFVVDGAKKSVGDVGTVGVDKPFSLLVSTRNLKRDRFLGAGAGGYYLESSFLNDQGLQRGHFHTACRILPSLTEAPDSSPTPAFFVATEDGGGSRKADVVEVKVPGIKAAGDLQCTSWAGDGSHRTPMMTRANQTPAIDSVRLTVTNDAQPAVQNDAAAAAAVPADAVPADAVPADAVPADATQQAAQAETAATGQDQDAAQAGDAAEPAAGQTEDPATDAAADATQEGAGDAANATTQN